MATQTSYNRYQPPAQEGGLATMTNLCAIDTRNVETSAGIGFGRAVSQGSGDKGALLGGTAFVGVSVATQATRVLAGSPVDTHLLDDEMPVLVSGDIWVIPGEAVTPADGVTFVAATGLFGKTTGTGHTAVTNARWMTSAAGTGDFAILRVSA